MTIGRAIRWRAWGADAFAEAHAARRPVLLSIHVAWSAACRHMDDETFADPAVVALVDDHLIPIRVDADQRPDIGERYSLGGWPTTVFLTPDGECLGGGTFVEPDRLRAALEDVSASFESRRDEIWRSGLEARRRRAATVHASAGLDDTAPARVAMRLRETFDETWAGFGLGVKVPDEAPLAFALRHGVATGDEGLVEIAIRTLDRIGWSDLSDGESGAFRRACATRDWRLPEPACLTFMQADLVRLFLDASALLGDADYADRARAGLAFVEGALLDRSRPGVAASAEIADGSPVRVDRTCYTDVNARVVRACLAAGRAFDEPRFAEMAVGIVERLVPAVYAPGAGVAHWLDAEGRPRGRGLLGDQVHVSAALLDAAGTTGSSVYLELAEELMRSCLRRARRPPRVRSARSRSHARRRRRHRPDGRAAGAVRAEL